MTDGEGRCITAICSFPGEESVAIEIPFSGNVSDAVVELKAKTMDAVTLRMAGDANAADEVDLMEEVIEDEAPPPRQHNGTKRKKTKP
ncbi:hypothetical protein Ndes2526B_g08105 [Nannochloris sp. 'desiccata']